MEEQVCVIYAGVNGYLDPLPVNRVRAFEDGLLGTLRGQHADILDSIRVSLDLDDADDREAEGRGRRLRQDVCLSHALTKRPSQSHRLHQGDAEDHQSHADGGGVEVRRAQVAAEAARPYASHMDMVLGNIAASVGGLDTAPRLLRGAGSDNVHLLLVCTRNAGCAAHSTLRSCDLPASARLR